MRRFAPAIWAFAILSLLAQHQGIGQPISADGMGKFWVLEGSKVFCIDSNGDKSTPFSRIDLGVPTSIDAEDPFRIVVFYGGTQNLVVLNNDAGIIGKPVNLSSLGLGEALFVVRSPLGGVWMAMDGEHAIVRLNKHLNQVEQTIKPPRFDIMGLLEHEGNLYAAFLNGSILVFDTYGSVMDTYTFAPFDAFLLHGNSLFLVRGDKIFEHYLEQPNKIVGAYHCNSVDYLTLHRGKLSFYDGTRVVFCEKKGQ